MDGKLSAVSKEVAVEMVKLSQKKGIKGSKGVWKDFLKFYDKTGSRFSDPSRRPVETLVAFLNTLDKPQDLKFLHDKCVAKPSTKLVSNKIERGADSAFSVVSDNVPDVVSNKLLVHGIPINVCCEDLHTVIPGNFTVEVKKKNIQGSRYSSFAIFKNQHEADEAFDSIEGDLDKDFCGRLQKQICFQERSTGSLWICKMAKDSTAQVASKRSREFEWETNHDGRKVEESLQMDNGEGHLKEIESLKQELSLLQTTLCESYSREIERLKEELSQRDLEICRLNTTIARLEFYMMHVGMCS